MTDHDITVLGAGVTGITAALTLQLRGHDTQVVADQLAYQGGQRDPTFSSEYGAGAIHPHAIGMTDLEEAFLDSRGVFDALAELGVLGVRYHRNCWIDEDDPDPPDEPGIDPSPLSEEETPVRPGADRAHGWVAEMPFADMPWFMDGLYRLYRSIGGTIQQRTVDRSDLGDLDGLVVNCTGLRSLELFDDPAPYHAVQGHLVKVHEAPLPRLDGDIASYTYTADDHGGAYCFPRMDGLIIGGTHRHAEYRPGEEPEFGPLEEPTTEIDGTTVPERIIACNRDLLSQLGVDITDHRMEALVGYRPYRDPDGDGVRLELQEEPCGQVVHSYGHGGAGVTMAWGSAIRVTRLVEEAIGQAEQDPAVPPREAVLSRLDAAIRDRL